MVWGKEICMRYGVSLFFVMGIAGILTVCCVRSVTKDTAPVPSGILVYWTRTADGVTAESPPLSLNAGGDPAADIVVQPDRSRQTIDGFGGAFNEAGWNALSVLPDAERESVLRTLFDPKGSGTRLNHGRVPIGASDYALERYSHNETDGDFKMEHFSIERDSLYLIPYIKAAMTYNPELLLWGSAWTPPTWMKSNRAFDSGHMLDDPKIYDAYALYLVRFIQAYQAEGLPMTQVAVQNEPKILTPYPSCEWEPEQYYTFIKNHLGPLMRQKEVKAGIMLGTFNSGNEFPGYIEPVLKDPEAARYVTSVGFQWDGVNAVGQTRKAFPDITLVQTETECGNWSWNGRWNTEIPGYRYNARKPQNDDHYGVYTWNRIRAYFKEGVNSYFLWNIVLDEYGLNNNRQHPWPQNAPVVVDRQSKSVIYTPMYQAFWHYSHYIEPGAVYVECRDKDSNAAVFRNPDGTWIIEVQNNRDKAETVTVSLGEYSFSAELSPRSFHTFRVNLSD